MCQYPKHWCTPNALDHESYPRTLLEGAALVYFPKVRNPVSSYLGELIFVSNHFSNIVEICVLMGMLCPTFFSQLQFFSASYLWHRPLSFPEVLKRALNSSPKASALPEIGQIMFRKRFQHHPIHIWKSPPQRQTGEKGRKGIGWNL